MFLPFANHIFSGPRVVKSALYEPVKLPKIPTFYIFENPHIKPKVADLTNLEPLASLSRFAHLAKPLATPEKKSI
jgi:hypothetical protein